MPDDRPFLPDSAPRRWPRSSSRATTSTSS